MIPVTMGSLCTVTCGSYLLHELVVVDGPVFRHRSDVGLLGRLGEAEQRELRAGVLAQSSLRKQHATTGYSPFTLTGRLVLHVPSKSSFFISGTFDLFDVTCKQYHGTALNPFLNGTKNSDVNGTCK